MSALSASEIAAARADLDGMLPDTGTIQRVQRTSDGAGGFDEAWNPLATLPCRLSRVATRMTGSGEYGHQADRLNDQTTHTVTFTAGTDVVLGDRVIIGAVTFEVLAVRTAGSWELARHVELKGVPQ